MDSLIKKIIFANVVYPHAPELLLNWSRHVPCEINFKGKDYRFEFELLESATRFKVSYEINVSHTNELSNIDFRKNEGQLVLDVLNHIISILRTFDYSDLKFKRITPNDSIILQIEIYKENGELEFSFEHKPNYQSPIQFRYLFMQLEDHDGLEGFHFAFEGQQLFALELLIEANHALMANDYNVCILHCCTAIESYIFPILEDYIRGLLLNKGNSNVKSVLKELPMNIKYELVFGTVKNDILNEDGELLEKLKGHNKLRNSIIHSGYSANRDDAYNCLNDASRFIRMVYLGMKDLRD